MNTLEMPTAELPTARPARVTWYVAETPRRRRSPRDRPPIGVRVAVGFLGFASMLAAAALLLSDRAPGVLTTLFGDHARQLWERIDATERIALPSTSEIPPTDFVAHVAIWVVVTTLIGLAVWTWRGLAVGVVALSGVSLLLERAQGRYASTRTVQVDDAVANLVGVGIGTAAVGVCYVAWTAGASLARAVRRPPTAHTNLNGPPRGSLR